MNTTSDKSSMQHLGPVAQLFVRLALGIGFLWPVMDRLGWLGAPDSGTVAWGSWDRFVTYTNTLIPFVNRDVTNVMALTATAAEIVFGICLIAGYQTRLMALGGAALTLIFALCMAVFISPDAPLNYPVFVFSSGNLLLATITSYKWSVDGLIASRSKNLQ